MLKSYKFRIYPNKEQVVLLQKTFGCARFVYNQCLAYRIDKYNNVAGRTVDEGKSYTFYFINPELYDKGKQEKCKIVDVYSDTEEEVLSLDNAAPTVMSEEVIIT